MSEIVPVIVIGFLLAANILVIIYSCLTYNKVNKMIVYLVKVFDAVQKGVNSHE